MLSAIIPKLPMRNKLKTRNFFQSLGFRDLGNTDYDSYLMLYKDNIEIHFFEFEALDPNQNYGQVYIRTHNIDELYQHFLNNGICIHPNGNLSVKPWGQKEFSLLDPDNNLLTFGQALP